MSILMLRSAAAQVSPPPEGALAYLADMSPYDIRQMSGSYAPTNGMDTILEVTPTEWLTGPGTAPVAGVLTPWCGGFKALTGTKCIAHGGGHMDSANNGLPSFDFAGTSAPTGFTMLDISAVAAVQEASTYTDGRPQAVHTYDGCVLIGDTLYRFGGGIWGGASGFTPDCFKYHIPTDTWTQLTDCPVTSVNIPSTIHDPVTGKVLVQWGFGFGSAFFDTNDETWSGVINLGTAWPAGDTVGAYDTTRGRGIFFGNSSGSIVTVDFVAETLSRATLTPTGATDLVGVDGPSIFYDEDMDVYWIFGGPTGSAGYSNIYEMDPDTWVITEHALSATMSNLADMIGSYGRFVFLRASRAIGLVTGHNIAPYVIKLPAA